MRGQLDGQRERLQAVGPGERVVRDDEIESSGGERALKRRQRGDAHDLRRDALRGQAPRDQLAVRLAVFEVEDAEAAHAAWLQLPTIAETCSNSFALSRNASAPRARQLWRSGGYV